MSITDELREWMDRTTIRFDDRRCVLGTFGTSEELTAIADRVDAAHKAAVDKAHADGERNGLRQARSASEDYRRGYEAGKADGFDEGFASADDWLAEHEDEMAEHGWVRGPLDADGKMWRSGDMSDSNWGEIEGIAYEDGRWFVSGHDMSAPWVPADSIRHYHAPTVEDVLNEMLAEVGDGGVYAEDVLVAKYAERLQLKEEDA